MTKDDGRYRRLRDSLEDAEAVQLEAAMLAFHSHLDDDDLEALANISYAAGIAHGLAHGWEGIGDMDRAVELGLRGTHYLELSDELFASLRRSGP
jgi:hypothetical protein